MTRRFQVFFDAAGYIAIADPAGGMLIFEDPDQARAFVRGDSTAVSVVRHWGAADIIAVEAFVDGAAITAANAPPAFGNVHAFFTA